MKQWEVLNHYINGNQWGYCPSQTYRPGGTRKIADIPLPCSDPGHNPPSHMVFPRGVYEHVCPSCGHSFIFTVNPPTL